MHLLLHCCLAPLVFSQMLQTPTMWPCCVPLLLLLLLL
jgi:hypothetical protein